MLTNRAKFIQFLFTIITTWIRKVHQVWRLHVFTSLQSGKFICPCVVNV